MAKMYEKIILKRLEFFLASIKPDWGDGQFGFSKGKSTTDMLEELNNWLDLRKDIIIVCDILKAFDSINLQILIEVLLNWNLPKNLFHTLQDFLRERKMVCFLGENTSTSQSYIKEQFKGVSQGAPLSPTLWKIFLHAIIENLEESKASLKLGNIEWKILIYADDLVIAIKTKNNSEAAVFETFYLIDEVEVNLNKVDLNMAKSKTEIMTKSKKLLNILKKHPNYCLVSSIKILGVHFGSENFCEHVDYVINKVKSGYEKYVTIEGKNLSCSINRYKRELLVFKKLIPSLLSNICIWGPKLNCSSKKKLNQLLARMGKFVIGSSCIKASHNSILFVLQQMNIESLIMKERRIFQTKSQGANFEDINVFYRKEEFELESVHPALCNNLKVILEEDPLPESGQFEHRTALYIDGSK